MFLDKFFDLIEKWYENNLDIIYFVYGMAFIIMGITILVQPKKGSKYKLGNILWLLAGFGLIHGFNEFLDMWDVLNPGPEKRVVEIIHVIFLIISYVFLFEFGRRLLCKLRLNSYPLIQRVFFSWWIAPLIVCVSALLAFMSPGYWDELRIWVRYILGFPGAILTGIGFILFYKSNEYKFSRLRLKKYFYLAGVCFFLYGILAGVVVDEGNIFLSRIINTRSFIEAVHIPAEAIRAACALCIAWAVYGITRIFYLENVDVLRRTTEELRLEYQAGQAKVREIERLLAIKSQFISMVSHELKTPLTAIKANIDVVLNRSPVELSLEQKSFLNIACDNVNRLSKLINDVLGLQAMENGRVKYDFKDYNINDVITDAGEIMLPLIKDKRLGLVLNLEKDLPAVSIDRDRIIQVLNNLINNAIKFTISGNITITSSKKNNFIQVSVEDAGAGIKREDLLKIFEPFTEVKKKGGTGLGLSICREIITAHRGRIWAESEFGVGSKFSFILPVEWSEQS